MATVTNLLKKQLLQSIVTDLNDSANEYYVGIAKSDPWNATDTTPAEVNAEDASRKFRNNLIAVKRISDFGFIAPRTDWDSGESYPSWSDAKNLDNIDGYFVKTDNNSVYICLEQALDATGLAKGSTVNPQTAVGTSTKSKRTSDGYVWKYAYTISALNASKYMTSNYIPVEKLTSASTINETLQFEVQDSAVAGSIVGYRVVNAGAGYINPVATVFGNGDSAEATIRYDSDAGTIISVNMADSSDNTQKIGSAYDYASISISSDSADAVTTPAEVHPIISSNGLGFDPRDDLNAHWGMFNVKAVGTDEAGWPVNNDFRQIGIIRNPKKTNDSDFSDAAGAALKWLNINYIVGQMSQDTFIRGATSKAAAYVDYSTNDKVYYHQNENTGFKAFTAGETIQDSDDAASNYFVLTEDSAPDYDPYSGEVLYIENRAPILRDSEQTENIKIIIKL